MSDIHGQDRAFFDILKKINFSDNDDLYILGDIIDRGSGSIKILEYVFSKKNIHFCMGNHEKMMLEFYLECDKDFENKKDKYTRYMRDIYSVWMRNGGMITLDLMMDLTKKDENKVSKIMKKIEELPYYFKAEVNGQKFLLCHARPIFYEGYSFDDNLKMLCASQEILWERDFTPFHVPDNYIVIHGHSPVQNFLCSNSITRYSYDEVIDIDCGCAGKRRLGCLRLDDMKEFYSDKMV
jgi:serine/threonine protein phosphatase 1